MDIEAIAERYANDLRPQLEARRRIARYWVRGFWATLAAAIGAFAAWLASEPFTVWWLLGPAVVTVAAGMVAVSEILSLQRGFRESVSARLTAAILPGARHEADGRPDEAALGRAGLFPRELGLQRREFDDRVDLDFAGRPLWICSGGVWRIVEREDNRPDEQLFSGTVFAVKRPLPLSSPIVLAHADVVEPPLPAGCPLDRWRLLPTGHPLLDRAVHLWCAVPADARWVLTEATLDALAGFVERHPGGWRVVIDAQGIVGGIDGPLLARLVHPSRPLPPPEALTAESERLLAVLSLLHALTTPAITAVSSAP